MLIPETDLVWRYLHPQDDLRGFVLIGGSGLALQIAHRLSEDLDFVWTGIHLPRKRLDALIRKAESDGFSFVEQDDPAAMEEFEIAGMDLHDFQQDYVVNGKVKVTFFTADAALSKLLQADPAAPCRIADLLEIFDSKALVSASRSKSRDWFDLYVLMREHGFTIPDYVAAFAKCGRATCYENGLSRMCTGVPQRNDEGFEELASPAPTLEEMASYFRGLRDQYEIDRAAAAGRKKGSEKNSDE